MYNESSQGQAACIRPVRKAYLLMHTPLFLGAFPRLFACLAAVAASGFATMGFAPAGRAADITTLATFNGTNGTTAQGNLTRDSQGNLFGTTVHGGSANNGAVFEVAQGSMAVTPLASFTGANTSGDTRGVNPYGGVAIDAGGNLFGTTYKGGSSASGTVWEIAAGTTTLTTLVSFNGTNGSFPQAGLTLDSSGNLFGTTANGGTFHSGTVFEIAHGTATLTTLASFTGGAGGSFPQAGLTLDSSGNLFGTTTSTVFKIAAGTTTLTTLASFSGPNAGLPTSGVTIDSSGNLYGTTEDGGAASDGTVWELPHGSSTLTTLAVFNGTNGANPNYAGVTIDAGGNLFGTTEFGGSSSDGTIWEIAHGSGTLTTVAAFNGTNGSGPIGGVTLDGNGNLYGTTSNGGSTGSGTVYEVAGVTSVTPPSSHAHLLWNKTDGTAALWTVNADSTYASAVYGPFSGWTARATSAAPDGTNWLLWTNTSGQISLWHVTALTASGYTSTQYGPYPGYQAVSLSVGGDGSPHILWDGTNGTELLWTVNKTTGTFTDTAYGPFAGWTANQVASGATVTDLLWTNTNGAADGYRIAANGSLTTHTFGPYPGYAAKSLSVGPDDGAHILWDNTNGAALLWNVDFSSGAFTYTSYGPFSGYSARAIATGPDNVTHILWDNTNGTAALWAVTGSGFTSKTYGPFPGWTAAGLSAGP